MHGHCPCTRAWARISRAIVASVGHSDTKTVRCAVYIRVSTRDQRYLGQFREIRRAVEARGWTVARVFREKRSGAHASHRPAWQKLRSEAALRRFGAVAVWALDRMGRSTIELLSAVQAFKDRGIRLLIVRDGLVGDGSSTKLVLTILAAVAELERDLISERTRVGLQAAKDSGKRLGRPEKEIPIADLQAIADGIYTAAAVAKRHQVSKRTIERKLKALQARDKNGGPETHRIPQTLWGKCRDP